MNIKDGTSKLGKNRSMTFFQAEDFFEELAHDQAHGSINEKDVSKTLISMSERGESEDELSAAVSVMSRYTVKFNHDISNTIDTCGTGGDGKKTINLSSAVAVILSSLNIPVIKHGNRSQSGFIGSADIFEMFNVPIELETQKALDYFDKNRFIFLFAPKYQPAMKKVAPIRKRIGKPTIFNLLGPLLNPGNPQFQIIGIGNINKLDLYAKTLKKLKRKNVIVYSSLDGFDEISTYMPTKCCKISGDEWENFMIYPNKYFKPFLMPSIKSPSESKKMFYISLEGKCENLVNLLSINAFVAFSMVKNIPLDDAFYEVKKYIKEGIALRKLESLALNMDKGFTGNLLDKQSGGN